MSLADELLDGISTYTTDPTEEPHVVINPDRTVVVPEELKKLAVQFDHNVETVAFDCPRYWDGLDMSQMKVQINYIRSDNQTGCYETEVTAADDTTMYFNWVISNHVTEAKGEIAFLVCVKKTEGEEEVNHWNSELCRDCYISEGLETEAAISNEHPDVIEQLFNMVQNSNPGASDGNVTLKDRTNGKVYTVYTDNGKLMMEESTVQNSNPGSGSGDVALKDRSNGKVYTVYTDNGKLMMEESEV